MDLTTMDIPYQNYDAVFKNAFSIFHNQTIDFLGLNLPPIDCFLDTEFAEITVKESRLDLNFRLADGSILHLEEETDVSVDDLIRFASYDLKLYNKYRAPIHTIIMCLKKYKPQNNHIDTGTLTYRPIIYDISVQNADEHLLLISSQIASGQEVNPLSLIFLPLMQSRLSKIELLHKVVDLEKQLPTNIDVKEKMIAATLAIADKLVKRSQLEKIWEEVRMFKIIEFAEEKGIEQGIQKGLQQGKTEALTRLLLKKFNKVPTEYLSKINSLTEAEIDNLLSDIFELQQLDDLKKYLH